jgi:hypothetical protein
MRTIFLICFLFLACTNSRADRNKLTYEQFLQQVKTEKATLRDQPVASARHYLFTLIHTEIPSYWGGTPWDFNGVTRTPGQGKIACGYFITNTLTDLGFPIERVKLAQAASSEMIKAITVQTKWLTGFEALKTYLAAQPDESVFIVGLDFHTGYITKEKGKSYFIHSNYINQAGVMKEEINRSAALQASKVFMIGNLGMNDELLKKWLAG